MEFFGSRGASVRCFGVFGCVQMRSSVNTRDFRANNALLGIFFRNFSKFFEIFFEIFKVPLSADSSLRSRLPKDEQFHDTLPAPSARERDFG